jgi:CubicO group peptidase (beta-lactamase class C family)
MFRKRSFSKQVGSDHSSKLVDKLLAKWQGATPGCAVAVIQDGRIVCERACGMANLDHDVPISPVSVFHVGSVSKQFTAASIMILAQEGKLSLDDPVRDYLSELPDFDTPITIRQLIHHTSGLRDQWELLGLAGWRYSVDLITNADVLSVVARQRDLNFPPGSEFMYSNTGYTLLGEIVQRVSHQSFRKFMSSRIFEPLAMKDTHFRDDHAEVVKNIAYGYVEREGRFRLSATNFDTVGATSLLTTVRDLARWDANFYTGQVGGSELMKHLQEPGKLNSGEVLEYAFGLMIGNYRGTQIVHHAGADAGYRAELIRLPKQRFSVVCLSNLGSVDPSSLARKVADIYLGDKLETNELQPHTTPSRISATELAARAGLYVNLESDDFVALKFKKRRMFAKTSMIEESIELIPIGENRFRYGEFPVELSVESGMDGGLRQVTVSAPLQKPISYKFAHQFEPDANRMREYAGTYYSDEVEANYQVAIESGRLVLSSIKLRAVPLRPLIEDLFAGWFGRIRFTRNKQGVISGIRFNSSRVRHFRLKKLE